MIDGGQSIGGRLRLLAGSRWTAVTYVLAVTATALAAALRWALTDVMGTATFVVFYPAIVVAAVLGGFGPGLTATLLSALCIDVLFTDPSGEFGLHRPDQLIRLAIFLIGALGVSLLGENQQRARIRERQQAEALRKSEEALRKNEAQARGLAEEVAAIMDAVPVIIFLAHDPECRNMSSNRLSRELLRLPEGANASKSAPPDQAPANFRTMKDGRELAPEELPMQKAAATGREVRNFELTLAFSDGTERIIFGDAVPLFDHAGKVRGAVGAFTDITERKQAEEALAKAKAAADASNKAKDHFLAVLSHELRTPLTPVLALAQAMETDPQATPSHRESATLIRRNIELEARLIDDLLDVTRISRGKIQLHFTTVDVHDKLKHVAYICESDVRDKQIALALDLRATSHWVQGDPARLQQCFWNVLKNAIKFTPVGGKIRIGTQNIADGRIAIAIADTGIGIEPERLGRIFNAFDQGGEGMTRIFGGLGLGLTISRSLVELHGGTIAVQSPGKGQGSTFTIKFPVSRFPDTSRAEVPATPPTPPVQQRLGILLVEDHADTRNVMAHLLGTWGYRVVTTDSVASGIEASDANHFDLLISDLGLPDGSGLDLMRQLRGRQSLNLKSIALSGYGQEEDVRKSREAGFNEHLTKPVDLRVLKETIRKLMEASIAL